MVGRGQDQHAAQPDFAGSSGGLAAMVALRRAGRYQDVGALCQRIGDQEFQLAGLVAAKRQPREVVAFDEQARSAQGPREVGRFVKRGG